MNNVDSPKTIKAMTPALVERVTTPAIIKTKNRVSVNKIQAAAT